MWCRASRRTGCAASSGRGPSTSPRIRWARSPSAFAGRWLELLELCLRRGRRAERDLGGDLHGGLGLAPELGLARLRELHRDELLTGSEREIAGGADSRLAELGGH